MTDRLARTPPWTICATPECRPKRPSNVLLLSVADVWVPPQKEGEYARLPAIAGSHPSLGGGMLALARYHDGTARDAVNEMQAIAGKGRDRLCALFPQWEIRGEGRADSRAWGVLREEGEWCPDLTLVGANSGSLAKKMIFGSIAQKVVTKARGSVRVGRSIDRDRGAPVRLILGMDGSPDA